MSGDSDSWVQPRPQRDLNGEEKQAVGSLTLIGQCQTQIRMLAMIRLRERTSPVADQKRREASGDQL